MSRQTVLLTGLPRSGTTLACELLNRLPDTVALDEPIEAELLRRWAGEGSAGAPAAPVAPSAIAERIDRFVAELRESITTEGRAVSRHVDGRISGSGKISDEEQRAGVRKEVASRGVVRIDKELSSAFLLVVKHPAEFTAVLEPLERRFTVYAIVRNPLSLLCSWNTVPLAVRRGRSPFAELVDPELAGLLDATGETVERQLLLLDWFFGKYRSLLPGSHVIPYEAIVSSHGGALAPISPAAGDLHEPLESRNAASVYDRETMSRLAARLLERDGPYWDFYTRESVEDLVTATR